jgi:hypothetical protein
MKSLKIFGKQCDTYNDDIIEFDNSVSGNFGAARLSTVLVCSQNYSC